MAKYTRQHNNDDCHKLLSSYSAVNDFHWDWYCWGHSNQLQVSWPLEVELLIGK